MISFLSYEVFTNLFFVLVILFALFTAAHVVSYKRDVRSAAGWTGIIIFFPLVGAVLYWMMGVNRIKRKAVNLRFHTVQTYRSRVKLNGVQADKLKKYLFSYAPELLDLNRLSGKVTHHPAVGQSSIMPLSGGDEAYPEMLKAIRQAKTSISLSTYLFSNDSVGKGFIDALAQAASRGVAVRVLIDSVGMRYSFPSVYGLLKRKGVRCAKFMPTASFLKSRYMNLRNHRKIMVVDGCLGFTGGMNIAESNCADVSTGRLIRDLHFKVTGPVVAHLQETFCEDWFFTVKEKLNGDIWFPDIQPSGKAYIRAVADGPDEFFERHQHIILGALSCAKRQVRIITPYFLPDTMLINALNTAALRGVKVEIIIPERSNLRIVDWASYASLWQLLDWGCRIWRSGPHFEHTKLMTIDEGWALVGSSNWDPRSFRLNFEFNLEVYSMDFVAELNDYFEKKKLNSMELFMHEVDSRSSLRRLRDGAARLLTPYL